MTEPTPIRAHRRYTRRQKVTAVLAADMASMTAASEALDIPLTTIDYWMDLPEFVELRRKTREDQGEATRALGMKVLGEIRRRLPEFEPRDLSTLYGILTDKGQLLSGQATTRTETRDLTDTLDDHERAALRTVLDEVLAATEPV